MRQTLTTQALILKRHNYRETDRVVTLVTPEWGKVTVIAKGARSLKSSKRGLLEPGNTIKAFFVKSNYMPLLTQAQIIDVAFPLAATLDQLKNMQLILELFDRVLVEEELEPWLYEHILAIRERAIGRDTHRGQIRQELDTLLTYLGFPSLSQSEYASITDYVASITEKPLKSWQFLQVQ